MEVSVIVSGPAGQARERTLRSVAGQTLGGVTVVDDLSDAGPYVLLLEAGQELDRHACMTLLGAAERTGADVVSGLLYRRSSLLESRPATSVDLPHRLLVSPAAPPDPAPDDDSRFRTAVYHRLLMRLPVRRGSVVFESGQGAVYGGSPRAVYEQIRASGHPVRATWSYATSPAGFPKDATLVRRGSWGYYLALARAEYWVDDHGFPEELAKRLATTSIYTPPGTACDYVGFDAPETKLATRAAKARLRRAVNRYDFLVAGSGHEAETLKAALRARAEPLPVGNPRNDLLVSGEALDRVDRLAAHLGLAPGNTVVLCVGVPVPAPGPGFTVLDFDALAVHDVTSLLRLTDVLVTGVGPLLFDFLLLDRPVVLYTPVSRRIAYVDVLDDPPGPVVRDAESLAAAVRDARRTGDLYRPARRRLVEKYGEHERGSAAKEITERFFAP
ncbi:CDP-glycerol glycerophosphotransferase family protein [Nonomuraea sp. NPDC050556]|uniref:CDP-glycerol glycerophosphotransferase family protein n=1 Tax=Nonomuraea sp. NPDC050556 TaxID=3364369 RepID=UPI00378B5730